MRMRQDVLARLEDRGRRYGARLSRGRRVDGIAHRDGEALIFEVARKLDSPNTWRAHWAVEHKLTQWWERTFETALALRGADPAYAKWLPTAPRAKGVRRVSVVRVVTSRRQFIKDDDNLRFTTKPINDALKRLGLIEDDRRELLEQPLPEQRVSPTGMAWTFVRIEPVPSQEAQLP